jgi:hypothetical protein
MIANSRVHRNSFFFNDSKDLFVTDNIPKQLEKSAHRTGQIPGRKVIKRGGVLNNTTALV